jgi:shikimate kinase
MDSDQLIEQRLGCSIREYFEREGEVAFRDVEEAVLASLLQPDTTVGNLGATINSAATATELSTAIAERGKLEKRQLRVLSTGGGSVLREANRKALRASGHVVYLRASPEDVFRRLRHDRNRPLLQVGDPVQRLRDLYALRDPLYRETAHFQVETGRPSVATLVNMISMQLELAGVLPAPIERSAPIANEAVRADIA